MPRIDRVAIIGLGLIGGSLGLALRRKRLVRAVVGVSRRAGTRARAKTRGAIDRASGSLPEAVQDAQVVVLAVPVGAVVPSVLRMRRSLRRGTLLMDVGSTKAHIVRGIERILPAGVDYVGAHPIAGSERRGIEAADAGLFQDAVCVLTPGRRTSRVALARARKFWTALGMRVLVMSPAQHDRLLAGASHLPHAIAFSLARAVSVAPLPAAPRSFLDMTRIAKSDPDLWKDILLSNRPALIGALDRFVADLRRMRAALAAGRPATVRRLLSEGKRRRDALEEPR